MNLTDFGEVWHVRENKGACYEMPAQDGLIE